MGMEEHNTNPVGEQEKESLQEISSSKETVQNNTEIGDTEDALDTQKEVNESPSENQDSLTIEEPSIGSSLEDIDKWNAEEILSKLQTFILGTDWFKHIKQIQTLQSQYEKKFQEDLEAAKKEFLASGENEINFYFKPQHKKDFDQITYQFRQHKRKHYLEIETKQKANLERKKIIVEELKELITVDEDINSIYKKFKALQDSWYNTGPVPRLENQNIWQTYRHHVERFYDFLHLNRELRELDFKHNYEAKLKLIERAEELVSLPDVVRASRELNTLHQMWKNDLGPVMREHSEALWKRFQEATKQIQKRRQEYQKDLAGALQANLERKNEILTQMKTLLSPLPNQHKDWQSALQKFQELREGFKAVGHVAGKHNKIVWQEFREIGRNFMKAKNDFYKEQKKEQKENVKAKNKLIDHLKNILESDDWETRVDEVKGLQKKWKTVGFIPRKIDNKLWATFQENNTLFFDRLRSGYQKLNEMDEAKIAQRSSFIASIEQKNIEGDDETIRQEIDAIWDEWETFEPLKPSLLHKLDQKLAETIINKIKSGGLSKDKKIELENYCKIISIRQNSKGINDAIKVLRSEINANRSEINQLENNLEFFSQSSTDNPLYKEAKKKIAKIRKTLDQNQEKLIQHKQAQHSLNKKQAADNQTEEQTNTDDIVEEE